MAATSIADKLAKLEKKIAKREKTIADDEEKQAFSSCPSSSLIYLSDGYQGSF